MKSSWLERSNPSLPDRVDQNVGAVADWLEVPEGQSEPDQDGALWHTDG